MLQIAAERILFRRSFFHFACAAWRELRGNFVPSWHIEELCDHLQAVSERKIKRLALALPPGTSKSTIACVLWTAWHWTWDPGHRWMFLSVDPALVKRDALECRALVESDWYQARWGDVCKIAHGEEQADGALEYYTTAGGLRFGTSLAAKGVGWHVHTQVADDLLKPTECDVSACARARLAWSRTFAGRIAEPRDQFARVLLQQRLGPADMIGYALDLGYECLILPLSYDPTRYELPDDDPRRLRRTLLWDGARGGDRRTVADELLCPERITAEERETLRREQGAAYLSQQEQDPTSSKDRVWDVQALAAQRYSALPSGGRWAWDWDLASKGKDQRLSAQGSFSVGWCWYETDVASYLVEEIRHEGEYPDQRESVRDGYRRARGLVAVEDKANGPAIESDLRGEIGDDFHTVQATKSKLERAVTVSRYQDRVYLPRAPWVDAILAELDRFPAAPNDRGDVLSQHLARRWLPPTNAKDAREEDYKRALGRRRGRSRR